MVAYEWHKLPVSHNKLRLIAKLARGLYWREAMLQLEFHRKSTAVHVKNTIAKAVDQAEEKYGLNPALLVVHSIRTGKGKYLKTIDYKAKGRAGMKSKYTANLTVILKQVTPAEIQLTRYYERWRNTSKLLDMPWEERVKLLPRYKPIEGYDPGVVRVRRVYAEASTVDRQSSRELHAAYKRSALPGAQSEFSRGHPGPEYGSNRGYNVRMHRWNAVGTPKRRVVTRIIDPVCRFRKRKVRRT